jgi:hypothetical protein
MGARKTVRGSRYGDEIAIMEHMHWTIQELDAQPADLVDELIARMNGQARAEKRIMERSKHGSG